VLLILNLAKRQSPRILHLKKKNETAIEMKSVLLYSSKFFLNDENNQTFRNKTFCCKAKKAENKKFMSKKNFLINFIKFDMVERSK